MDCERFFFEFNRRSKANRKVRRTRRTGGDGHKYYKIKQRLQSHFNLPSDQWGDYKPPNFIGHNLNMKPVRLEAIFKHEEATKEEVAKELGVEPVKLLGFESYTYVSSSYPTNDVPDQSTKGLIQTNVLDAANETEWDASEKLVKRAKWIKEREAKRAEDEETERKRREQAKWELQHTPQPHLPKLNKSLNQKSKQEANEPKYQ